MIGAALRREAALGDQAQDVLERITHRATPPDRRRRSAGCVLGLGLGRFRPGGAVACQPAFRLDDVDLAAGERLEHGSVAASPGWPGRP